MNKFTLFVLAMACVGGSLRAQQQRISGQVTDPEGPVPYARIVCLDGCEGALTDIDGRFELVVWQDTIGLELKAFGYLPYKRRLSVRAFAGNIGLEPDPFFVEEVVVTSQRRPTSRQEAMTPASVVSNRNFATLQAQNLAEGIGFATGLRLENNCQNCGFSQVRMNGLPGPYTQILINSRPVFSALSGVYGLDQIPAVMIRQIETVRGAGSVLYGGNAIAGTVNILTRKPEELGAEVGGRVGVMGNALDQSAHAYASVPFGQPGDGFSVYAFQRRRDPLDVNGDGFSEITKIEALSFGLDGVRRLGKHARLTANVYALDENRRGGSDFGLRPHQARVAEALGHQVAGSGLTLDLFSQNLRHKVQFYLTGQYTRRDSYYGAGGRVIAPGDSLTEADLLALNAYGATTDAVGLVGVQYAWEPSARLLVISGLESNFNRVDDRMPGYGRRIFQQTRTTGAFIQTEWKPLTDLTLLAGVRAEQFYLNGQYDLGGSGFSQTNTLHLLAPRASLRWKAGNHWVVRAGYAQGYRAPQAFDEDLHIETVGGAARFTRLSEDLETERSHGFTASLDYDYSRGAFRTEWVAEGFFTRLNNPFITADAQELPGGISVLTKRNGDGARVAGVNLEARLGWGNNWEWQNGITVQTARYDVAETIWEPQTVTEVNPDSVVQTARMLRAPNTYGFSSLVWRQPGVWEAALTASFTGSMLTPHVIDPETEFTRLVTTRRFWDVQVRVERIFSLGGKEELQVAAGVKNLFNQFQRDFDTGPDRDASYVYGPAFPRTGVLEVRWVWGGK